MLSTLAGIFLILHGFVHLWYLVLAFGFVEYKPDMGWTGRSWIFSRIMGDSLIRSLAGVLFAIAALAFIISGIVFLAKSPWAQPMLLSSAILSSLIILFFWDGSMEYIVQKGVIGLLLNIVVILLVVLS